MAQSGRENYIQNKGKHATEENTLQQRKTSLITRRMMICTSGFKYCEVDERVVEKKATIFSYLRKKKQLKIVTHQTVTIMQDFNITQR